MKKKFILTPLVGALLYILLSSYESGPAITAGLERTGASGGTIGCGGLGCHSTGATSTTTLAIQLYSGATLVTSYTGGAAYTIRITGTQTSSSLSLPNFGFQVAVMKTGSTTVNEGTLSAIAGTHTATASGINLVEHSSPILATTGTGGSGTTYVLDIPWTAPVAGTGNVTVFSTLNAVNLNTAADAGDKWNNTSLVIPEATVAVASITGTMSVCAGSTTPLGDATTGGTWSSSNPSFATIGASTGLVTGIAAGIVTITYTAGTGSATATVTINPLPAVITGTMTICTGGTATLADVTTGGTWSSGTTTVATVGAGTGSVAGISAGTSAIIYTLTATGCKETATVTVTAPTPVTGTDTVCTGATIMLSDAATGGTWSSGTTSIATVVAGTGVVTGVATGTSVISYTLPGGCVASKDIVVESVPGTIAGHDTVCVGSTITLTENLSGGTWGSSNTHASIGTTTGIVTGATVGMDTIKYTVTNMCGTGTATHAILVRAAGTCNTGVSLFAGAADNELNVYPNPAREGNFTVNLSSDFDEEAHIVITNIVGARVKELTTVTNKDLDVQLGNTTGIYLLTAITMHGKYVVKVVVE